LNLCGELASCTQRGNAAWQSLVATNRLAGEDPPAKAAHVLMLQRRQLAVPALGFA